MVAKQNSVTNRGSETQGKITEHNSIFVSQKGCKKSFLSLVERGVLTLMWKMSSVQHLSYKIVIITSCLKEHC